MHDWSSSFGFKLAFAELLVRLVVLLKHFDVLGCEGEVINPISSLLDVCARERG
jgi:hypothetical protein